MASYKMHKVFFQIDINNTSLILASCIFPSQLNTRTHLPRPSAMSGLWSIPAAYALTTMDKERPKCDSMSSAFPRYSTFFRTLQ